MSVPLRDSLRHLATDILFSRPLDRSRHAMTIVAASATLALLCIPAVQRRPAHGPDAAGGNLPDATRREEESRAACPHGARTAGRQWSGRLAHTSEHVGARGQADEPQRPSACPCTGLGGKAVDGGRAPSPADTTHEEGCAAAVGDPVGARGGAVVASVVEVFDAQRRRGTGQMAPEWFGRKVEPGEQGWTGVVRSDLQEDSADRVIAAQPQWLASPEGTDREFEWKPYSHDRPADLAERLTCWPSNWAAMTSTWP